MPLFDCCVNLADAAFDHDRAAVIARAQEAGVVGMLLTACDLASAERCVTLVRSWHCDTFKVIASAGIHPHQAHHWSTKTIMHLRRLCALPEVQVAGETGLDFYRNLSPPSLQEKVFIAQLTLASETGLSLLLHQREAHTRFVALLRAFRPQLSRCVVHCFTDHRDALRAYLDLDCYIGITGWVCDERRGVHLRPLLSYIPSDRLLLESDAPYLLPRNLQPRPRGHRNEPAFLPQVAHFVAACLKQDVDSLAQRCTDNAIAFLGISPT